MISAKSVEIRQDPRSSPMRRADRLRKALRGGFGYAVQQEAWDAALPDWRRCLRLVNRDMDRRAVPLTPAEIADVQALSRSLQEDKNLARCWYQLLMQDLYRSCPPLGGWFPE